MNRFFRFVCSVCVVHCASPDAHAAGVGQRPPLNIVFIIADDMGWTDLACYGSDLHETPNIDRLAANGMRFTRAYSASPVCTPTRASIMTGKHPARLHMTVWYEASQRPPDKRRLIPPQTVSNLPHSEYTLGEAFHDAGYLTAHVGKWHLGDAAHYPEAHGFDINVGGTFWGAPQTYFYPYRGSRRFGGEFRYVPGLDRGKPGEYLTDRLTDEALNVIDDAADRPFFLHMAFHSPHTPIEAKADLVARYKGKLRPGLRHRNPEYAAMIQSIDENVGRLLTRLKERGLADHTAVIFTSDNGGYINRIGGVPITNNHPLRSGKGTLYEGGIRVPLIVHWPGVTSAGSVCPEPVYSADLYPTLLDMAGLETPKSIDGLSLASLLKQPDATLPRDGLFFHYPHYYHAPPTKPVSAILARNWKLLEFYEDKRVELYDLESDVGEERNLADDDANKVKDLRERLHAWRKAVKAQEPTDHPAFSR